MSRSVEEARRELGRLGLGLALMGLPTVTLAQAPADASAWLGRIQQAAADSSYQGTLMFSAGGVVTSTRLEHYCDGRQRYERLEVLDGHARLQYRHNERIVTVWPASKVALVEPRDVLTEFPALPLLPGGRTIDNYEIRSLGRDRVAGHDAEVLMARPRDRHRYALRLWAERETGLLLRSDVLGPAGEVLESSAFTDVKIGARPQAEAIVKPMKKLDGLRVLHPQIERTQLEAEGWTLSRPVPGFQLVGCTKRPLDVAADNATSPQVLQSVFSDGLAHVSVFIEPYDAARHKQALGTSLGATHTRTSRRGDWWVTIVGEVPMTTIQLFEGMLERRR